MPGMNAIYEEHDPDDLPPELQPLPDVDWGALSSRAVQRLVDKLPDEMLVDVPGDNRLMKGVLAEGIGIHFDDEVVPTVAGLAMYGLRPTDWLPGMRLAIVVDGGVPQEAAGSAGRLLKHLAEHSVGKRLGQPASRALVGFALAWRSWEDDLCEEGLVLNLTEGVLSLYVPGSVADEVTNPVFAELLWRSGVLPKRKASLKSLDRMLEAVAPEGVVVESEGDSTAFRWRLVERPCEEQMKREPVVETEPAVPVVASLPRPEPARPVPTQVAEGHRSAKDRQAELVQTLRRQGRMSRRQLQERLGWTRSTLRDVLRAAVEAGIVSKLAPHPRSPFQVYEVAERRPNHPRPPARTRWRR